MGFFGADDHGWDDGATGQKRHSDEASAKFLELIHLRGRLEVSVFSLGKDHHEILFLEGAEAIFEGGLGKADLFCWNRRRFRQEPKIVSEDPWDPASIPRQDVA